MIINNLELIAPLLPKDNPKVFCHMQIVCRAKDHKDEKVKEGAIKTYFIKNEEHLRKIMPEKRDHARPLVKAIDGMWYDNKDMLKFDSSPQNYRIKPEPKYRPFKNAEECWEEMQKHQPFGWIKSKDDSTLSKFMFIDSLRNDEVSISNVDFNYNDLVKYYTFIDGTPFGIKK